jgi:hypothetical protein
VVRNRLHRFQITCVRADRSATTSAASMRRP